MLAGKTNDLAKKLWSGDHVLEDRAWIQVADIGPDVMGSLEGRLLD